MVRQGHEHREILARDRRGYGDIQRGPRLVGPGKHRDAKADHGHDHLKACFRTSSASAMRKPDPSPSSMRWAKSFSIPVVSTVTPEPIGLPRPMRCVHAYAVVRGDGIGAPGLHCFTCHHAENFDPANVPGNLKWMLAPPEMAWQGKTLGQICLQLKDRKRNGGRTMAQLEEHMATDDLVGWGGIPAAIARPCPAPRPSLARSVQSLGRKRRPLPRLKAAERFLGLAGATRSSLFVESFAHGRRSVVFSERNGAGIWFER